MNTKFAGNKTKLATALGISRTLLYEFMRLADFPPPKPDGRWDVSACRKFIAEKRVNIQVSEKEQLQILILKIRAEREQFELDLERGQYMATDAVNEVITRCNGLIRRHLFRLIECELPGRCEGMTAIEIKKTGVKLLRECLEGLCTEFRPEDSAAIATTNKKTIQENKTTNENRN